MRSTKRTVLSLLAVLVALDALFALTQPGATACLMVDALGLHSLQDGLLSTATSPDIRKKHMQMVVDARTRIAQRFGPVTAQPIIVFFGRKGVGPFSLNEFGSTQFIASRACLMIGPMGETVDIVAHELMHAEIHHRVGSIKRLVEVPTWFDEGIAMQVDDRASYDLPLEDYANAKNVRELSHPAFFSDDEPTAVANYARAKHLVRTWLNEVGATSLYERLDRMGNGSSLEEILKVTVSPGAHRPPARLYRYAQGQIGG